MDTFTKQPNEVVQYTMSFADALATGATVTSVQSGPTMSNVSTSPPVGDSVPTVSGLVGVATTGISFLLAGGTNGQTYKVQARVNTSNSEVLEHEFKLKVKEQ